MSTQLRERLTQTDRAAVIDDTVKLIDSEVSSKGGISGAVLKKGYAAVKKLKGGRMIERAVDHLLDDFADALDPMYGTWQAKEDRPGFDRYLTDHADQATEALLSITDEKSERAESKIIRSTYKTLRGQAHKHVIDALPGVGRLIERHAPAQPDAT